MDADAILVVWAPLRGYISPPHSFNYEPQVMIRAHLVDATTKKDLYFKTFFVGYKAAVINEDDIPSESRYRYRSVDTLLSQAADAADGLISCETIGAHRIAADLKGN